MATVDSEGEVKAIKAGVTKITVTTIDGSQVATCDIEVKPFVPSKIVLVTSLYEGSKMDLAINAETSAQTYIAVKILN